MKKIYSLLPENWFSESIILIITSLMTFYLFRLALYYDFIKLSWYQDETKYVYTFLILQFIVKALFYWLLPLLIKKLIFEKIQRSIENSISEKKSIADLRAIGEIKKNLAAFLGFTVKMGWSEKSDFSEKVQLPNKTEEINLISKQATKWVCILLHTVITLIVVVNLNFLLMLPIFAIAIAGVIVVTVALLFIISNFEFLERTRKEVIKPFSALPQK